MGHIIKICLASLVCVFFSVTALPSAQAASQAAIQVNAEIINAYFWDCTFIKDAIPSKPSSIKVEWSFGPNGSNQKDALLIPAGKTTGHIDIVSAKGEVVNISICVKDAKNETLGKWGMQVTNKGQSESVTIALPDKLDPVFERTDS